MDRIQWERYPTVANHENAKTWLNIQANLGLAANTLDAYGRALQDYFIFSSQCHVPPDTANREHIANYVNDLLTRPNLRRRHPSGGHAQLANATIQQRLTAVRLYYDYLLEEGLREINPVGRGRYTPGKAFTQVRQRGLVPRHSKLPWIPNEGEWQQILQAAKAETVRNRLMLALAYDAALRREELCTLETRDIDPAHCTVQIRAETTKNHHARVVPYSPLTNALLTAYLQQRQTLSRSRGPLFLSESRRNRGHPISKWTWSKIIEGIAERSGVPQFTTHTLRHLRLTDLARSHWDIHEIAAFAGHRHIETTMQYIHLSGRDLSAKIKASMEAIHAWRIQMMTEVLK